MEAYNSGRERSLAQGKTSEFYAKQMYLFGQINTLIEGIYILKHYLVTSKQTWVPY